MVKRTTMTFLGILSRWLQRPRSVRVAMLAAGSVMMLGATFLLLTAYFRGEERTIVRRQAEAAESAVDEAAAELTMTQEHLLLLEQRLAGHLDGSAPFRLIEEHLDPEVGFSSVTVDYRIPQISFAVHAPNAGSIARQVATFENDTRILAVEPGILTRDRESERFETEIKITIDPAVLLAFPDVAERLNEEDR